MTSASSQLILQGTNTSFTGGVFLTVGGINLSSAASLGGATSIAINGGTTLTAGVASVTTVNPTITLDGNWAYASNALNLGSGAVSLNGNNVGFAVNTTNNLTLGGNIGDGTSSSGASTLTKAAQGIGSFTNAGAIILNGVNSYSGGTVIQQGQVQFGSAGSVPSSGSILLASQGANSVNFEGAAAIFNFTGFGQTQLGKVSSASVGVVGLGAATDSNALDFSSATGANLANVSLGSQGANTYSGTLTPWTSSGNGAYQLGGSGNQSAAINSGLTLTVSTNLGNSGSVATGLIVDPALVGFGASNVTLSGASSYTGGTLVNTGTLTLTGSLSSSSALTVNNSGVFAYAPTTAATTQTLKGLTVGAGLNSVTTANAANVLNLGTVTRGSSSGLMNFTPTGTINAASASNVNGILGTWASTGAGTSLQYVALNGSNNIVALGATGTTAATAATAADLSNMSSTTTNYSLAGTAATTTGNQTGNTLRYTAGAGAIALGTNTLTLNGLMNAGSGLLTISNTAGSNGLVTGSSGVLDIVSNTQGITISSVISGAGAVTYGGPSAGALTLSGVNTFSGGLTLNNGTLNLANTTAGTANLGTGTLTLNGGQVNSNVIVSISNAIAVTQGTSTLLNPNSNNFTLTGAITGSGTITAGDGGTFASLFISGDVSGFNGTIVLNSGGGNGDNVFFGGGTSASNNFSSTTIIGENQGSRRLQTPTGIVQIGSLEGTSQIINTNTIQEGALNTNSTFAGQTSGNVGLTKVGSGTWTLAGNSGWSINAGTNLTVNNGTLLEDMTGLAVPTNYFSANGLTLNGGALSILGKATTLQNTSQAFSGTTINAGASTIKVDNNLGATGNTVATLAGITRTTTVGTVGGGTVDFILPSGTQTTSNGITTTSTANVLSGIVTQANTNSVAYATVNQTDWAAVSGAGIISALASYSTNSFGAGANTDVTSNQSTSFGPSTVNSLRFNTDNVNLALTGASSVTTGGILTTVNSNPTGSSITGSTLTTGGGREFVFIDYGKLTVSSQLVNNSGGSTMLTKSGTGLLTLSNTSNAYSGINYLNDGIVNIAAAASLGTNATAAAISFNGGTLQLASSFNLGSTQGINLGFKGGTFDTNGNASTYSGVIASSGAVQGTSSENTAGQFGFTKAGSGVLTLTGINTYAGATTVAGGTLSVSYLDTATTSGNVSPGANAGGIGKSANYAKNLILAGGTLQYNSSGATASTDRLFTLGDAGGGLDASGSGAINFTNTGAVAYQINSNGGATNSSPTLTLTGTNTGANTLAAALANNGLGTTTVSKSGAGAWTLTAANSYSGGTTINAGTLRAANTSALGSGTVAINSGGTLALGADSSTTGALSTGAETWGGNGTYAWKIAAAGSTGAAKSGASGSLAGGSGTEGTSWDELTMNGLTITSGGSNLPFTIAVSNTATLSTGTTPYSWIIARTGSSSLPTFTGATNPYTAGTDLLNYSPTATGSDAFALDTSAFTMNGAVHPTSGFTLEFQQITGDGNHYDLILDYAATPEPGTAMLFLGGALTDDIGTPSTQNSCERRLKLYPV